MKAKIEKLFKEGLSQMEIAKAVGLTRSGVRHHLNNLLLHEKALVFNDLQIPFHDAKAVELTLKVGELLNPDIVVINGDLVDCFEISKFHKPSDLREKAALNSELGQARKFLHKLRERFPEAEIKYTYGNHEYRFDTYIESHARELSGLRGMSLGEQLDTKELDIEVYYSGNNESSWMWGKLLIGHFNRVSKHSAYTAKALVEDKGISLIQAHTHRGGSFFKKVYDRVVVGYENFCLCDLDPPYVDRPNWQQGFSIVYKDLKSDLFFVEQHPITEKGGKYRVFYNGEVVEV